MSRDGSGWPRLVSLDASPDRAALFRQLYRARRLSQETAYRGNQLGRSGLDVTIREILSRQAALVGLAAESLEDLVAIEIEVEKQSLVPNYALISLLKRAHSRGSRVIAVSDTPLSISDMGGSCIVLSEKRSSIRFIPAPTAADANTMEDYFAMSATPKE